MYDDIILSFYLTFILNSLLLVSSRQNDSQTMPLHKLRKESFFFFVNVKKRERKRESARLLLFFWPPKKGGGGRSGVVAPLNIIIRTQDPRQI